MVYEFVIEIEDGTTKEDAEELEAQLVPGIITMVEADFPPGCHKLVHVVVKEGGYQMFPRNADGTMSADDHVIRFNPHQKLTRGHHILKIFGWSPMTSYDHKITLRFNVQPEDVATPWDTIRDLVAILKRMLGI